MIEKRTDPHRPSAIDPKNYELAAPMAGLPWYKAGPFMDFGTPACSCDHCGHAIRYGVRFNYLPDNSTVVFGERCTDLIDLPTELKSRIGYEMNRVRIAAANERKKLKKEQEWIDRRARMQTEDPEIVEFIEELDTGVEKFAFLLDMVASFEKFGSLTVGQVNAVKKIMESREKQAAKQLEEFHQLQGAPEAPDGRQEVTGTILKTKWGGGQFPALKMTVKLEDGNKVFGSVPASIRRHVEDKGIDYRELKISFSANFDRQEEHFSYFNKPTKGKVL